MEDISLWFFHSLGFYLGMLRAGVSSEDKLAQQVVPTQHAIEILTSFKNSDSAVLPKSKKACDDIISAIQAFAAIGPLERTAALQEWGPLLNAMDRFHNVVEQEMLDTYTICITEIGAYSIDALVGNAEKHLSRLAEDVISPEQRKDYRLAGKCLAFDLYTASGFHAMRTLEAEARAYHTSVTGIVMKDVPLGAILNGDNKYKNSGLLPAHIKEGVAKDSPLGLIISLLASINKIYRCPVLHPEMTLDRESAKLVFNLTSVAISAMIDDAANRHKKAIETQP